MAGIHKLQQFSRLQVAPTRILLAPRFGQGFTQELLVSKRRFRKTKGFQHFFGWTYTTSINDIHFQPRLGAQSPAQGVDHVHVRFGALGDDQFCGGLVGHHINCGDL